MRLANTLLSFLCPALVALLLPVSSSAGPIIGATSVSSPQGDFGGATPLANIINQSGLSAGYTGGVTDFGTFVAGTTHAGLTGTGFTGTSNNGPQQFTFDLGAVTLIDAIAIWNTASVGAVTAIDVFWDTDNNFGNGVGGVLVAPTALGLAGPGQIFGFGPTFTRYVHVQGLNSLAPPDFYGLGEVVFSSLPGQAVPNPATLALLGLGLIALGWSKHQRA